MVYRSGVTAYVVAQQGLNVISILCGSILAVSVMAVCGACGSSWTTLEIKELLNSWESVLRNIKEDTGECVDVFDNVPLGLKTIAITWIAVLTPLIVAVNSMVFDDLSVCVFPALNQLGMIPESLPLPAIVWKILLFPVELFITVPPMLASSFNIHAILKSQVILESYADQIRLVLLLLRGNVM